jgi:hypothetical protein
VGGSAGGSQRPHVLHLPACSSSSRRQQPRTPPQAPPNPWRVEGPAQALAALLAHSQQAHRALPPPCRRQPGVCAQDREPGGQLLGHQAHQG